MAFESRDLSRAIHSVQQPTRIYVFVLYLGDDFRRDRTTQVHANCMKVGLKNAIELVPMLVDTFDFAVNEECNDWNECGVSKHGVVVRMLRKALDERRENPSCRVLRLFHVCMKPLRCICNQEHLLVSSFFVTGLKTTNHARWVYRPLGVTGRLILTIEVPHAFPKVAVADTTISLFVFDVCDNVSDRFRHVADIRRDVHRTGQAGLQRGVSV